MKSQVIGVKVQVELQIFLDFVKSSLKSSNHVTHVHTLGQPARPPEPRPPCSAKTSRLASLKLAASVTDIMETVHYFES